MMFGGEGPIMQGTWFNPKTGDSFTVRDSFFEDNQYVVTTTDGRYFKYDQLQNYIQGESKHMDEIKANLKSDTEQLPSEVSSIIEGDEYSNLFIEDDISILNKPQKSLGNLYTPVIDEVKTPINMNNAIIEKALKNTVLPKFNINVNWDNFPEKQIEMLKDVMEISEDEIIEWYLNNIQMIDVVDNLKDSIKQKILNKTKNDVVKTKTEVDKNTIDLTTEKVKTKQSKKKEPKK